MRVRRQTNPDPQNDHTRARQSVHMAVKRGSIQKDRCAFAGPKCRGGIESHHADYLFALDVKWVCRWHHLRIGAVKRLNDQIEAMKQRMLSSAPSSMSP